MTALLHAASAGAAPTAALTRTASDSTQAFRRGLETAPSSRSPAPIFASAAPPAPIAVPSFADAMLRSMPPLPPPPLTTAAAATPLSQTALPAPPSPASDERKMRWLGSIASSPAFVAVVAGLAVAAVLFALNPPFVRRRAPPRPAPTSAASALYYHPPRSGPDTLRILVLGAIAALVVYALPWAVVATRNTAPR